MKTKSYSLLVLLLIGFEFNAGNALDIGNIIDSAVKGTADLLETGISAISDLGKFPGIFVKGEGSSMSTSKSVNKNGIGFTLKLEQHIKNGILLSTELIFDVDGNLQQKIVYSLDVNKPNAKPKLVEYTKS